MSEQPWPQVTRILAVSYAAKDHPMKPGTAMAVGGKSVGVLEAAAWHDDLGLWEVCIIPTSDWKHE